MNKNYKDEIHQALLFFATSTFKDSVTAHAAETDYILKKSGNMILAYYATDIELTSTERDEILESYIEHNSYYVALLKKYEFINNDGALLVSRDDYLNKVVQLRQAIDHQVIGFDPNVLSQGKRNDLLTHYTDCLNEYNVIHDSPSFYLYANYWKLINYIVSLMAICRFISDRLKYIHDIDTYDASQIYNMLASHGLPFFEDIPMSYKVKLLKSLDFIIRYKGTNEALIEIMNIFGFEEVKLLKYYLSKSYEADPSGKPINVDSPAKLKPTLAFIELPYDEMDISEHIFDTGNYLNYDEFIAIDEYWTVPKEEVLSKNFNIIPTKYIGIEVSQDLDELHETTMFFEWFMEFECPDPELIEQSQLYFLLDEISDNPIFVTDIYYAILVLLARKNGSDVAPIIHSPENEFDFYSETPTIVKLNPHDDGSILWNPHLSYKQNIDLYNPLLANPGVTCLHSVESVGGWQADPKDIFRAFDENIAYYKQFNKSLEQETFWKRWIAGYEVHQQKFSMPYDKSRYAGFLSYNDYLQSRNPDLHAWVSGLHDDFVNDSILQLYTYIEGVVRGYADADTTINISKDNSNFERLAKFIQQVIELFKHYTVQLRPFKTNYRISDKIFFKERFIPRIEIKQFEDIELWDKLKIRITMPKKLYIELWDKAKLEIIIRKRDYIEFTERFRTIIKEYKADTIEFHENLVFPEIFSKKEDLLKIKDLLAITQMKKIEDEIRVFDALYMSFDATKVDTLDLVERIKFQDLVSVKSDLLKMGDRLVVTYKLDETGDEWGFIETDYWGRNESDWGF